VSYVGGSDPRERRTLKRSPRYPSPFSEAFEHPRVAVVNGCLYGDVATVW